MKVLRDKLFARKLPARYTESELKEFLAKLGDFVNSVKPSVLPDMVVILEKEDDGGGWIFSFGSEVDVAQDVSSLFRRKPSYRQRKLEEICLRRSFAHNVFV